jgi:hypothetical protein
MDNTTDFLLTDSGHATRPSFIQNEKFVLPPPEAEHGFSTLITIPNTVQGSESINAANVTIKEYSVPTGSRPHDVAEEIHLLQHCFD